MNQIGEKNLCIRFLDKQVFVLSPEPWGINHNSKHHYSLELAKRGNDVWFFNPPNLKLLPGPVKTRKIQENLRSVEFDLPRGLNIYPPLLRNFALNWTLRRIINKVGVNPDIVWSFDPFSIPDLSLFRAKRTIYFSVDVHKDSFELPVAASADLVLCTSRTIKRILAEQGVVSYNLGHAVADHFLGEDFHGAEKQIGKNPLRVGYVGNLLLKSIDWMTLLKVIDSNCDLEFYFMGPYEKSNLGLASSANRINELIARKNVQLLGALPSLKIPSFLRKMDILLLCYDANNFKAEVANPHKVLEYLSSGKPIVSNYTDEYSDRPDLINMAKNITISELLDKIKYDYKKYTSADSISRRIEYASNYTYSKQINRIEKLLEN